MSFFHADVSVGAPVAWTPPPRMALTLRGAVLEPANGTNTGGAKLGEAVRLLVKTINFDAAETTALLGVLRAGGASETLKLDLTLFDRVEISVAGAGNARVSVTGFLHPVGAVQPDEDERDAAGFEDDDDDDDDEVRFYAGSERKLRLGANT